MRLKRLDKEQIGLKRVKGTTGVKTSGAKRPRENGGRETAERSEDGGVGEKRSLSNTLPCYNYTVNYGSR